MVEWLHSRGREGDEEDAYDIITKTTSYEMKRSLITCLNNIYYSRFLLAFGQEWEMNDTITWWIKARQTRTKGDRERIGLFYIIAHQALPIFLPQRHRLPKLHLLVLLVVVLHWAPPFLNSEKERTRSAPLTSLSALLLLFISITFPINNETNVLLI